MAAAAADARHEFGDGGTVGCCRLPRLLAWLADMGACQMKIQQFVCF
jgi:hypothetical protein